MDGAHVLLNWTPGRKHGAREGVRGWGTGKRAESVPLVSLEPAWLQVSRSDARPSGVQLFCMVGDGLGGRLWSPEVPGSNLGSTTHQHPGPGQAAPSAKPQFLIHKMGRWHLGLCK